MKDYRAKAVIAAYAAITGNRNREVLDILKKSYTFEEILKGDNAVINYDSTISNILDIVGELSKLNDCPKEVDLITEENLKRYFTTIRQANLAASDMTLLEFMEEFD
jgi:hypothetical protein